MTTLEKAVVSGPGADARVRPRTPDHPVGGSTLNVFTHGLDTNGYTKSVLPGQGWTAYTQIGGGLR